MSKNDGRKRKERTCFHCKGMFDADTMTLFRNTLVLCEECQEVEKAKKRATRKTPDELNEPHELSSRYIKHLESYLE